MALKEELKNYLPKLNSAKWGATYIEQKHPTVGHIECEKGLKQCKAARAIKKCGLEITFYFKWQAEEWGHHKILFFLLWGKSQISNKRKHWDSEAYT